MEHSLLFCKLKLSTIIIFFSKKYNVFSEEDSGKSCQKTFCEAARFVLALFLEKMEVCYTV